MTKLEQEILEIINTTIDGKYIGRLRAFSNGKNMWELRLYLDRWFTPVVLAFEGTEDEFKEFVRKEIKTRKMEKTKYYSITRYPLVPELDIIEENDE